jgi:hypothetical protein
VQPRFDRLQWRHALYSHGRSRVWLKIKNPEHPAMQHEWEERLW